MEGKNATKNLNRPGNPLLTEIISKCQGDMQSTDNPSIVCSCLPDHWRMDKELPVPFQVKCLSRDVPDGTVVSLRARTAEKPNMKLRKGVAKMLHCVAVFDDLRFLETSGRGTYLSIEITIGTDPPRIANCSGVMKITRDGPRPPRAIGGPLRLSTFQSQAPTAEKRSSYATATDKDHLEYNIPPRKRGRPRKVAKEAPRYIPKAIPDSKIPSSRSAWSPYGHPSEQFFPTPFPAPHYAQNPEPHFVQNKASDFLQNQASASVWSPTATEATAPIRPTPVFSSPPYFDDTLLHSGNFHPMEHLQPPMSSQLAAIERRSTQFGSGDSLDSEFAIRDSNSSDGFFSDNSSGSLTLPEICPEYPAPFDLSAVCADISSSFAINTTQPWEQADNASEFRKTVWPGLDPPAPQATPVAVQQPPPPSPALSSKDSEKASGDVACVSFPFPQLDPGSWTELKELAEDVWPKECLLIPNQAPAADQRPSPFASTRNTA